MEFRSLKNVTSILNLTFIVDLDFGTKEKVLPQGIHVIWKLYDLPF